MRILWLEILKKHLARWIHWAMGLTAGIWCCFSGIEQLEKAGPGIVLVIVGMIVSQAKSSLKQG